jgi:hypothetical protein
MTDVVNPNVSDRHNTSFWTAPIGLAAVTETPVFLSDLPTSDPAVAGQLYNLSGTVMVSTG